VSKLRVSYMPLGEIQPAVRNPKEHDLPTIRGSITELGMADTPALDERTGRLIAGHGTVETLTQMHKDGEEPPAGVEVDRAGNWKIPVLRGWTSTDDRAAELALLVLNKAPANGGWDDRGLAELLDELSDENPDWPLLAGWTHREVDDLLAQVGDAEVMPPGPTGARYAESDEEYAERAERISGYSDRSAGGAMAEMILVFEAADHEQATGLIRKIRERDGDQPAAKIVLAALSAYAADGDD
jgi:hypothetical protein